MNMKSQYNFSWIPLLLQIRVLVGFIFAVVIAVLEYDNNIFNQLLTILPYIPFVICMALFHKKEISFRLWYIIGALFAIGIKSFTSTIPIVNIAVDASMILTLFLSPYIKKHYKKIYVKASTQSEY